MMRRTLQLLTALIAVLGLSGGCTDAGQQQEASGSGSTRGDQQQETTGNEVKQQETIGNGTNPQGVEKSTGKKSLTRCVSADSSGRGPRHEAKNEDPDYRIAYAADADYADESIATDIYVMDADGTDRTRLTNSELMELGPSWSPDGKKIAFTGGKEALYRRTNIPESFDTYVMNADGTALTKLADNTGVSIAWSPDGEKMVFSSWSISTGWAIYVMNADGTGRTSLVTTTDYPGSFDWSPDCKKIAFRTDEGIHVINADGSNLKRLIPREGTPGVYSGSYDSPAWSPDGKRIAYVRQDEEGIDTLYVMNADGTAETSLTNYENGETSDVVDSPTWSPDGEKIAFVSGDIYVMNADGSGTTKLNTTPEVELTTAWAPGG